MKHVRKYAFDDERLLGWPVFRLTQMPRVLLFVTDIFVRRCRAAGLEGMTFECVWATDTE